jgi:cytochrome oxidase Cu insertion factor (SCO1/SenC/PrrC family)
MPEPKPASQPAIPVVRRRPQLGLPPAFWLITVAVGVCAGAGLALLHLARPSSPSLAAASVPTPVVSWPAGSRLAPNFRLRDQNGRPISLSLYRGRPVIVTFIDPLCRNLCPVEAGILDNVEKTLPASMRPAILAVSVDPWGDSRSYLREDDQKWHLGAPWRWAVGSAAELEAVWRHYEVGVTVAKKTYAGVTERQIVHTEAAFVIDPAGYQRALYIFPFQASDLAGTVRQLAGVTSG